MKLMICMFTVVIVCSGCGNNVAGPGGTSSLRPPTGLQALSVDSAHVKLFWVASPSAADTAFAGYALTWGSVSDTLAKTTLQFTAGPLVRGALTFTVRARQKDGQVSDPVSITWAGAWRFDTAPYILTEYNQALQTGIPGFDAGTGTTDPHALALSDANADSTLDFYLFGPGGSQLQLVSANNFTVSWHTTLFSTVTTGALDLNAPLSAFPQDNTFTLQAVLLTANTVYYAKTQGNAGQVYYVRIHVGGLTGTFPSRWADIRISLQRVSKLPYA